MSLLIEGNLSPDWLKSEQKAGEFVRLDSQFRHWITPDGAPGPSGEGGFPAEAGRYHLYVSYACPWAHRTLIFREIKRLDGLIGVSVVHPWMGEAGWEFDSYPGTTADQANNARFLHELYTRAQHDYSGIVTVPMLWDRKRQTIVNNESSEIIRMFNSAFDHLGAAEGDYYPAPLRGEIDVINATVYENINNGVYRAGFAGSQTAYEHAYDRLFKTLDELERRLGTRRFLVGNRLTEADWRLFPTLLRFDAVYYSHFKCNQRRLIDYPNLWDYTRDLYQMPGIAATVNMDHIKRHYFTSHPGLNPGGIIPKGPRIDFAAPHHREEMTP